MQTVTSDRVRYSGEMRTGLSRHRVQTAHAQFLYFHSQPGSCSAGSYSATVLKPCSVNASPACSPHPVLLPYCRGRQGSLFFFFSFFFNKTSTYPTSSQSTDSGACSRNPCGAFEKLKQSGQANPVLAPPLPHWVKKNNRKRKTITKMVPNPLGGIYIKDIYIP